MKNKIGIFLSLISASVSLFADNLKINEIEKNREFGKISAKNLEIGETGFVIKQLANNNKIVIAYGEFLGGDRVHFLKFDALRQENLPKGKWLPEVGDIIEFKNNSNRALIIADSFEKYLQIEKKFDRDWIHPDLFATVLTINGHQSPLLSDFIEFCEENSVGRIFFGFKNKIVETECLSMREIKNYSFSGRIGELQKPFYSRIEKINPNWFGEGTNEIGEFESYYRSILERQ